MGVGGSTPRSFVLDPKFRLPSFSSPEQSTLLLLFLSSCSSTLINSYAIIPTPSPSIYSPSPVPSCFELSPRYHMPPSDPRILQLHSPRSSLFPRASNSAPAPVSNLNAYLTPVLRGLHGYQKRRRLDRWASNRAPGRASRLTGTFGLVARSKAVLVAGSRSGQWAMF